MLKISIGILGYNEEYGIKMLLDSLQEQTLLKKSDYEVEIIVVSNGSSDDTVGVALDICKVRSRDLNLRHRLTSLYSLSKT